MKRKKEDLQVHDILKEKNSWLKCVYCVIEHTICNFVSKLPLCRRYRSAF